MAPNIEGSEGDASQVEVNGTAEPPKGTISFEFTAKKDFFSLSFLKISTYNFVTPSQGFPSVIRYSVLSVFVGFPELIISILLGSILSFGYLQMSLVVINLIVVKSFGKEPWSILEIS